MSHNHTHEKAAGAIRSLADQLNPSSVIMPIGLDGAVIYHLLRYRWERKGIHPYDYLTNTVHASPRDDSFDQEKFEKVLTDSTDAVYGLDLRTQAGALGNTIRREAGKIHSTGKTYNPFLYTVLFDSHHFADIRGTDQLLTDEEIPRLYWVPGRRVLERFMKKRGDLWIYNYDNLSHEFIADLDNVTSVKNFLNF